MTKLMTEAAGLHKSFGDTHALRGLDIDARESTILGVLGPNGAGKTTAVRILTTLVVGGDPRRCLPARCVAL
jgi:ABC-type multidrug transport system ATPase subunit